MGLAVLVLVSASRAKPGPAGMVQPEEGGHLLLDQSAAARKAKGGEAAAKAAKRGGGSEPQQNSGPSFSSIADAYAED